MDAGSLIGLIGGIAGGVIGVAGGILGTYCSIKVTRGPKERAFMQKASVVCWVAIGLFLGLMFLLPNPYRSLLWLPYGVLLPLGIFFSNRAQQRIRKEESQQPEAQAGEWECLLLGLDLRRRWGMMPASGLRGLGVHYRSAPCCLGILKTG